MKKLLLLLSILLATYAWGEELIKNKVISPVELFDLLESYFEKKINSEILLKYNSMKCASILRESMWSMVSEITSEIDFNYENINTSLRFNDEILLPGLIVYLN